MSADPQAFPAEDCPNCGNNELKREHRPHGGFGVSLPYTRWSCIRCQFTWYTPAPITQAAILSNGMPVI